MAAATLDDHFNSRMVLGLGMSTPHAVVNIHGMIFERPVRRAHETIEVIRRLLGEADTPSRAKETSSPSKMFHHSTRRKEDSAVHFHCTWREYMMLSDLPMLRRQLAEQREK